MKKINALLVLVLTMVLFSQTALATIPFSDHLGHKWENGIEFVYNRGIVEGYPDGTYQPYRTLNRAELLKIIVASAYSESSYNGYEGDTCFNDIDGTQWYTKYVCFGKAMGIVEGYPDSTFKPEQNVNFVEALKIILIGMDVGLTSSASEPWYQMYYDTASAKSLIPDELYSQYAADFSRAQAAEVIQRILSLDADIVQPPVYTTDGGYEPGSVYIGYMQEGDILEIYLIADSSIDSYTPEGMIYFNIDGNTVSEIRNDQYGQVHSSYENFAIELTGGAAVYTNEVLHIATLYLAFPDTVTIEVIE